MINLSYIILGAGASGLMLAYRMSQDSYFDDKPILIIDKVKDKGNDKTWSYWEDGEGEWDEVSLPKNILDHFLVKNSSHSPSPSSQ